MSQPKPRVICRSVVNVCGSMTWPAVTGEVADTGRRLRYAPQSLTEADHLFLASLVDAYIQMVSDPQAKRNAVCREVRAASVEAMA